MTKKYMTKKQAVTMFKEGNAKFLEDYKTDKVAIRTAWHMYTDMLCKDGEISQRQYDTWLCPFK